MANKCTKCFEVLNEHYSCRGRGKTQMSTCNLCRNTGVECVTRGVHRKN